VHVASGADLGCSSNYSIGDAVWRLKTVAEKVSMPTAVARGQVGRKPSGSVHFPSKDHRVEGRAGAERAGGRGGTTSSHLPSLPFARLGRMVSGERVISSHPDTESESVGR